MEPIPVAMKVSDSSRVEICRELKKPPSNSAAITSSRRLDVSILEHVNLASPKIDAR
jgi:hypothetical protein